MNWVSPWEGPMNRMAHQILFCFCEECAKWAIARFLALQAGPNQSYQRFARKVVLTSIIITHGPPFERFGSTIHIKRA
jgi:hypothetical protein